LLTDALPKQVNLSECRRYPRTVHPLLSAVRPSGFIPWPLISEHPLGVFHFGHWVAIGMSNGVTGDSETVLLSSLGI
jgi:hypothetical protein